jgi:heat shock protein HtpX
VNKVKTWVLIAGLGGLFVAVGSIWGAGGMVVALVIALVFNFSMYWFSDKIAIATTRSKPVTEQDAPELYRIVRQLTQAKNQPMPKMFVSEMPIYNAFATGRNPNHAAVSVTRPLLSLLDERELRGVLSHELSHVANRDILIGSIAAGIGMSITFLARMVMFGALFGGGRDNRDSPLGGIGALLAIILAPLAAALIQLAVTRSREYQAEKSGAQLSHDPQALASALRKIEAAAKQTVVPAQLSPATAHLFIVNPFKGKSAGQGFAGLFSTHPPTEERIRRLEEMARHGV